MENIELELLLRYPLISYEKSESNSRIYHGHIFIEGMGDVYLKISVNDADMCRVQTRFTGPIDAKISQIATKNIADCLDGVGGVLREFSHRGRVERHNVHAMRRVLQEYAEFTKFRLDLHTCKLSADLSQIKLSTLDDHGREHFLTISVDPQGLSDRTYTPVNVELPKVYAQELETAWHSISDIWEHFTNAVESLQFFFLALEELDANCSVQDPAIPTKSDCHRRIYLDENLSLVVTVRPERVTDPPEITFLGPEHMVCSYMVNVSERIALWDSESSLLQSLLDVLHLDKFPSKRDRATNGALLVDSGECSICFSTYFNGKMPDILCGNPSCGLSFHQHCLSEWFIAIHAKYTFNLVVGNCPNCQRDISCPITEQQ